MIFPNVFSGNLHEKVNSSAKVNRQVTMMAWIRDQLVMPTVIIFQVVYFRLSCN